MNCYLNKPASNFSQDDTHAKDTQRHLNSARVCLLALLLAAVGLATAGCASTNEGAKGKIIVASPPGPAGVASEEKPFVPPHDPAMGQIVVAVPSVAVSAPVTVNAGNIGQTIRSQLASVLSMSPNFLVADRETMKEIAAEQSLAEAGQTDPRDRPVKGKLASPRYLIKVDVTEFKEDAVGKAKGAGFKIGCIAGIVGSFVPGPASTALSYVEKLDPTIGNGKQTVQGVVGFDLRIIDVDTGSVIRSARASSSLVKQNSTRVLGIAGFDLKDSKFSQSVMGQSTRLAVQDAVTQIHGLLREYVLAHAPKVALSGPALASSPEREKHSE